jgi:copper resistance protein C
VSYGMGRWAGVVGVVVGVLIGLGVVFVWAPAAGAHTALKATSPRDGGAIDAAPSRLLMEFTAPILSLGYRVVVQGPDGEQYQAGTPLVSGGNKMTQPLKPLGPPGEYRVEFRIVAYDGHPLTGGMRFTLTKPGPAAGGSSAVVRPAPLAAVSTSVNNAPPWAAWTGGAVAVALISGAVVFGRKVTRDLD